MKKLSLLLVVLLAAGSAGLYGQMAIGTNFSISGEATATAGYDIDDEQFGFKNESSANIKIVLVAKQSTNNDEMVDMSGGWYGSIELNDFQIVIDSDEEDSDELLTVGTMHKSGAMADGMMAESKYEPAKKRTGLYIVEPTIVATLKNGPLWLQIFDAPASKADLIAHIEDDEDNDREAESHDADKDVGLDLDGHGVTVGYTTADLSIAVGILSEVPYDSESEDGVEDDAATKITDETAAPHEGSYAVSADLKVNVGPATLDLAFVQGLANGDEPAGDYDNTGVGAKLTTDFGDVSLSVGADVNMTGEDDIADTDTNEAMDWEAGGNATVTLTPNTTLKSDFIVSSVGSVATDVKVNLSDKNGLVESLDMSLTWGLFDIANGCTDTNTSVACKSHTSVQNDESDLFVEGKLDYHLSDTFGGMLTPGTTVTVNQIDGGNATVGLEVRAVLTEAVPATTFGLKWKTAQLVEAGTKAAQSGVITLWTKIKY